jgi:hypothetical protein
MVLRWDLRDREDHGGLGKVQPGLGARREGR